MDIGTIEQVDIDQQMRLAYLDYAMSVIVARALPDAARWTQARPPADFVRHARYGHPLEHRLQKVRPYRW